MRKLATAALFFAAAIFLSRYLLPYDMLPMFFAVSAAISLAGFLLSGNKRLRVFIALLSLAAGFIWSWTYTTVFITGNIEKGSTFITDGCAVCPAL